jgi:hypothetical protein
MLKIGHSLAKGSDSSKEWTIIYCREVKEQEKLRRSL